MTLQWPVAVVASTCLAVLGLLGFALIREHGNSSHRYTLTKLSETSIYLVRLDTKTGQLSICTNYSRSNDGSGFCSPVKDFLTP
jgi:hypothetical protein